MRESHSDKPEVAHPAPGLPHRTSPIVWIGIWINTIMLLALFALYFTPVGEWAGFQARWLEGVEPVPDGSTPENAAVLAATRNLITVLGPIFIGLAVWMVTVVAERRLKHYDETQEKLRIYLEERADALRRELEKGRKDMREEILDSVRYSIEKEVRDATVQAERDFQESVKTIHDDLNEGIHTIQETQKQIEDRFGHIAEYARAVSDFGPISSVGAVHARVTRLFEEKKRGEAVLLVRELLDLFGRDDAKSHPAGTLNDWYNLSAELGRNDEELLALEVTLAGLAQQNHAPVFKDGELNWQSRSGPPDRDLLAHAVMYARAINDPRLANILTLGGYDKKKPKGRETWGWRNYSFTMQALVSLGRIEEALELGEAYTTERTPDIDSHKVVAAHATILRRVGREAEAIKLLENWLNKHPSLPAAHVITDLIDWQEGQVPDDRIIKLATRGIRDLAEEQPSSSLGNYYYRRALAHDRLALDAAEKKQKEACTHVQQALRDYTMARSVARKSTAALLAAPDREKVLRDLAGSLGCDLPDDQAGGLTGGAPGGTGSETSPDDAVKDLLTRILPVIVEDSLPAESRATQVQKILSGAEETARLLTLTFLRAQAEDEDVPAEMRKAIAEVLAHLD